MLKYITSAFNNKQVISIDLIFLDFSNAFNTVPHDKLFKKLSNVGITDNFLKIIINMFKERKEFVNYNNCNSLTYIVKNGIPQRGVSSPIFFNLYKSDIINCIYIKYSKLFEFADDSVLVKIVKSNDDRLGLHEDLNKLSLWCYENNLSLNLIKTELLSIHTKPEILTLYKVNNTFIKGVKTNKNLDVILDLKN
jgi:hypothetical protein